jgi:MFS family permease
MLKEFQPVLKNRHFLYLWSSQVLSLLTIHIMNFVLLTRLFERTGSTVATSLLWIAYALPAVLVGPFAAALVDVRDRKQILIVANLVQSLIILTYALSHQATFFFLYAVVFVYSFLNQFYIPAESASLPSLVTKEFYTQANSLFFMTQHASLMIGFAFGGVLLHFLGFSRALFVCASFVFIAFLCVLFLPKLPVSPGHLEILDQVSRNVFRRIGKGYSFITKNRRVLAPFFLLLSFQISVAVIIVNLPALAQDVWKISTALAGPYIVVPAAVGAMLGAAVLPRLISRGWRKRKVIETSLLTSGILVFALLFLFPQIPNPFRVLVGLVLTMVLGMAFVGMTVPSQTIMQEATPLELRGRVFGNFSFLVNVTGIVPIIFSGTIAHFFGIRTLFSLLGIGCLGVFLFARKLGQTFGSPHSPRRDSLPGPGREDGKSPIREIRR